MRLLIKILLLCLMLSLTSCPPDSTGGEGEKKTDTTSVQPKEVKRHQTEQERIDSILRVNVEHDTSTMYELPRFTTPKPSVVDYRLAYSVSFNSETLNANWVAWCLTRQHTHGPQGDPYSRSKLDPPYYLDLDTTSVHQEFSDWDDEFPYEHGHLCPAADNKWNEAAMRQSFFLSNMSPQHGDLNGKSWENLEYKCREWAEEYGEIYIVTGPVFYKKQFKTLPRGRIAIPDAFFKVVLRLNPEPGAIGFIFNNNGENPYLFQVAKSVDEVEKLTGIDFFYLIDDETESAIEKSYTLKDWNIFEQ